MGSMVDVQEQGKVRRRRGKEGRESRGCISGRTREFRAAGEAKAVDFMGSRLVNTLVGFAGNESARWTSGDSQ